MSISLNPTSNLIQRNLTQREVTHTPPRPSPTAAELPIVDGVGPVDGVYTFRNFKNRMDLAMFNSSFDAITAWFWIWSAAVPVQRVGEVFRLRQRSSGRYVETHAGVVLTTPAPTGQGALWVTTGNEGSDGVPTTVRHLGSGMLLGAANHDDHRANTDTDVRGPGTEWRTKIAVGGMTLQQASTGRFLDAHESGQHRVVSRPEQSNDSQFFDIEVVGGVYEIHNGVEGDDRFLDAHVVPTAGVSPDFNVVTRPQQNNATQHWAFLERESDSFRTYTIQQVATGRFLSTAPQIPDAWPQAPVVTAGSATTDFQRWAIF